MKKYYGNALGHWITVGVESKTLYEMRVISVSAAMESIK